MKTALISIAALTILTIVACTKKENESPKYNYQCGVNAVNLSFVRTLPTFSEDSARVWGLGSNDADKIYYTMYRDTLYNADTAAVMVHTRDKEKTLKLVRPYNIFPHTDDSVIKRGGSYSCERF